jgi:Family of unknown function (DUF6496)
MHDEGHHPHHKYKHEAHDKHEHNPHHASGKSPEGGKVHKVMHEFKHGELHSGSKHGPEVKSRKQAVAIALSEQRKQNKGGY